MDSRLHTLFDDLDLWFEHVAVSGEYIPSFHCPLTFSQDLNNTYTICFSGPLDSLSFLPAGKSHTVTFTSTDPSFPLPNPGYLRLHAAVCRVAHMSGVAKYLKLDDRKFDELNVLARDGSSTDLLTSRLAHVALMG